MLQPLVKCSGVYVIVNQVTGSMYVGSSFNVMKRVWEHLHGAKGSRSVLRAVRKHGRENLKGYLLEAAPRDELPRCEAKWIKALNPVYNRSPLTDTGGRIVTEAQRELIRAKLTGKKLTAEHRAKISAGLMGRIHSSETRSKIGARRAGRKHAPESIARMVEAAKWSWTAERRAKIARAQRGRKQSAATIAKRSEAAKRQVISPAQRALMVANSIKSTKARAAARRSKDQLDLGFIDKHYKL